MKKIIPFLFSLLISVSGSSQKLDSIGPASVNADQNLNLTIYASGTHFHPTINNEVRFSYKVANGTDFVYSVMVIDSFSLSANMHVPNYIPTGDYDVIVSNSSDGTLILPKALHVTGLPTPVAFVSPQMAKTGTTVDVVITGLGTHFKQGSGLAVKFSGGTVNSKVVISDTLIHANITVPEGKPSEKHLFSIYNTMDGFNTIEFYVIAVPKPALTSVGAPSAEAGKTMTAKITGTITHFTLASNIVKFGFSTDTAVVSVINDSVLNAVITIPQKTYSGEYDVLVSNSIDGPMTLSNQLYVHGVGVPALTSISPSSGSSGQTLDIFIYSKNTHFTTSATQLDFTFFKASGIKIINSFTIVSDTILKANVTIPSYLKTGNYLAKVSSAVDGIRFINFHVNGEMSGQLISVTPSFANSGQRVSFTLAGTRTNFKTANGVDIRFDFTPYGIIPADSVNIVNDTVVKGSIAVPATVLNGDYGVSIYDSIDGSIGVYKIFHVNGAIVHPYVASVNPGKGKPGQTMDVTIISSKTHWMINEPQLYFDFQQPKGTQVLNAITYINDTILIGNITIPPAASAGNFQFRLMSNVDEEIKGPFTVESSCLAHFKTTYDEPTNTFTLTLDSATTLATSFYWDFDDGSASTDQLPSHTFAKDTLYTVCLSIKTASGDSCIYCHEIGKDIHGNPVEHQKGFSAKVVPFKSIFTEVADRSDDDVKIRIYPNPAKDDITLQKVKTTSHDKLLNVVVFAADGKQIELSAIIKSHARIDVSGLTPGIYFIHVYNDETTTVLKFIKE